MLLALLLLLVACAAAMTSGEARAELQLPRRYSEKELKSAYRKRSVETHPDKGGSTEQFLRVSEAYELLSSALGGGGGASATRGSGSAQGRPHSSSFSFSSSFGEGVSQEEMMRRAEEMFDTVLDELMQGLDGGGIGDVVETMLGPAQVIRQVSTPRPR